MKTIGIGAVAGAIVGFILPLVLGYRVDQAEVIISTIVFAIVGGGAGILFGRRDRFKSQPPYVMAGIIGLLTGVIGVLIGALPIGALHHILVDFVVGIFGSYSATPGILHLLAAGVPLPIFLSVLILPIGGAIFGLLGAIISVRIYHKRELSFNKQMRVAALWGAVAGLLFNMFVSFWIVYL